MLHEVKREARRGEMVQPSAAAVPHSCGTECQLFAQQPSAPKSRQGAAPMVRFKPRQTIYECGDPARHCYRVIEGSVRLSRILMDGHRQVLDFALPGDTFGIKTFGAYTSTADAIGEVAVLRCPQSCMAYQLMQRKDAAMQLAGMLSEEAVSAQDHVAMLTHQSAVQRVALFLLRFAKKQAASARSFELPVGRQDMADYLGLTIETTCRALSDMKERGVISIGGRRAIEIRDREALETIAAGDGG